MTTNEDQILEEAEVNTLEYHATQITKRFERFYKRVLITLVVLGVANTVALVGFGVVLENESDLSADIQKQRFDTLVELCQNTNSRYNEVNAQIDTAIAELPTNERIEAEERAVPFRLIIQAAVPYTENCREYADSKVEGE